jgi:hypothetical protein
MLYLGVKMKLISILLGLCLALPCFSCADETKEKLKVFARIIEKSESELHLAVFYPNEIQKETLNYVTFGYYRGEKFVMLVEAKISNNVFGFSNINIAEYSSSYIALDLKELNNVAISIHYRTLPGPDGVSKACSHIEYHKLNEIIEKV